MEYKTKHESQFLWNLLLFNFFIESTSIKMKIIDAGHEKWILIELVFDIPNIAAFDGFSAFFDIVSFFVTILEVRFSAVFILVSL